MAFAIDASALHRPLGFELPPEGRAGDVAVVRHSPERPGAAAAAILPPDEVADAERRRLRAELERSGGVLRSASLPAPPHAAASARGVVDGHGVSLLGFASGRPVAREPAASTGAIATRDAVEVLLLTDARLAPASLERLLRELAARSFASLAGFAPPRPRDSLVALANGVAGAGELAADSLGWRTLLVGGVAVAQALVRRLLEESFAPARARLVQVTAANAGDEAEAARIAELLAADPALRAALRLGAEDPAPAIAVLRAAGFPRATARVMVAPRGDQAVVGVALERGSVAATRWTAVAAVPPPR